MSFLVNALQNPTGTYGQSTSFRKGSDKILDVQIEQLVQLCLRTYGEEKAEVSVKTIVGGDLSLLSAFFRASIRAGALGGEIYVATEAADSSMIRGMALWWGPGVKRSAQQRREFHAFVSQLSPEAQEWHSTVYRPDFANLTEKLLGPRGKLDSWYLNLLAVDSEHQRLGVARALIDAVREKASIR
ncbi:hypothetical protein B0H13DRAFT_1865366 [Mycena leptocephala]|nr:hypothetical protein B0H13DRAFT_1865366 [Mycena leptocephala]